MAGEALGMDMSESIEASHKQNLNGPQENINPFSPTGAVDLTGVKQVLDPMDLLYDEENPVKDEIMEDLSENLAKPQHFSSRVSSVTAKKYAKLRRRYHFEKILRLIRKPSNQDYEHYVMALKVQSLEIDRKIKETLWKKSKLDLTMSKMDKQIKSYELQKIELDLAKSKLEYTILQSKNRTLSMW